MNSNETVIGITMGDPGGIGPEIVVKALSDPLLRRLGKFIIFGIDEQLEYAADLIEVEPFWGVHQHEKISRDYPNRVVLANYDDFSIPAGVREPNMISGQASVKFCLDAIYAARAGIIDAVVTAPISKESWKKARVNFPGHTELFAQQCKCSRVAMMFTAGHIKIALATIHQGLFDIRNTFTIGRVFEPIDLLNDALKNYFGVDKPKIGVAALNPHAGESGQFGDEEIRIIRPAIEMAISQKINAFGPYPADTLFLRAARGEFDGVVAMYHDQGMIPIKLLAFNSATNVTIGLPIIRTSPAHGTAFDIAWLGKADESSMKEAIKVAAQMAGVKKAGLDNKGRLRRRG
ncbi:4-hydroxythreonine-4-phosphate dehydrogenase 2 [Limihaloglobus sulfuriphilus]|uniref:4-hydroxythreonine-4-phosphate dehydrogenase 2 n=1 Tax=Limihaloglobus sulfuriphilus TaxID=1851148 RepID=A0A1Q2MD93_9BACT|nr:4-hydroxythreonine-4-phosphate dehydrogenase PdxA [Limihaloglobus sulfuriphilus]AQQ70661.1 4-hydroxythreonine-4-phosphate dehydrogenase 2 [Limihaloglobus sulfuriphilus]